MGAKERLAICEHCPHLFRPTYTCKRCGCFMQAKARIQATRCPEGLWTT
jgi:hypothetical protein